MLRIELEDGKYTYVRDGGSQKALRHGEEWRDLLGDKFVAAMANQIESLQLEVKQLKAAQDELKELHASAAFNCNYHKSQSEYKSLLVQRCKDILDEVRGNINPERGYADDLESDVIKALAEINSRESWVTPSRNLAPAKVERTPIYAFRRKGQDSFCTCDAARYEELSQKPAWFETRVFYEES